MSEDFKAIYKILSILQESMDFEEPDLEKLSAENLGITRPSRKAILRLLAKSGYIEGLEDIRITLKGLEYLEENSLMQKAARLAKGIAEVI